MPFLPLQWHRNPKRRAVIKISDEDGKHVLRFIRYLPITLNVIIRAVCILFKGTIACFECMLLYKVLSLQRSPGRGSPPRVSLPMISCCWRQNVWGGTRVG